MSLTGANLYLFASKDDPGWIHCLNNLHGCLSTLFLEQKNLAKLWIALIIFDNFSFYSYFKPICILEIQHMIRKYRLLCDWDIIY